MANTPPLSPQGHPTALDDYLEHMGLSTEDIQYLATAGNTLHNFIEHKMLRVVAEHADEHSRHDNCTGLHKCMVYTILEAVKHLNRHKNDRQVHMPCVPGVPEGWIIAWAEREMAKMEEIARMKRIMEASRRGKIHQYPLPTIPETVSTLEAEQLDDE